MRDSQMPNEDLFDEFLGREVREFERERLDDGRFESDDAKPVEALLVCGEALGCNFRAQNLQGAGSNVKAVATSPEFVARWTASRRIS